VATKTSAMFSYGTAAYLASTLQGALKEHNIDLGQNTTILLLIVVGIIIHLIVESNSTLFKGVQNATSETLNDILVPNSSNGTK
jgi:hypothetical protein